MTTDAFRFHVRIVPAASASIGTTKKILNLLSLFIESHKLFLFQGTHPGANAFRQHSKKAR
jgi:hypothetical protein